MKRQLFLPVLFTTLATIQNVFVHAQYIPLVEESKYWIYYDFQWRPRPTTGFLITIQGDTLVQNTLYKKVYKYELGGEVKTVLINEPPIFIPDIPYTLIEKELISLIREDVNERLVYNLAIKQDSCTKPTNGIINHCNDITFCDTLEHILFDFSLNTGDTLNYCSYAPLHYSWEIEPEIIDSIKFEMHFEKIRRTFYTYGVASYLPDLNNPGPRPPYKVQIIEGIGFRNQGIFNYRFGNLVDYCEGDFDKCGIVSVKDDFHANETQVNVYPNPTSDYLKVESNERIVEISLMNPNYKEFVSVRNENLLNLNQVPCGFYICTIKLENGEILNKKVVKLNR